jgi:integrase
MASIWKSPNSPYWIARVKLQDGRWANRSTKETDNRKARKIAEQVEEIEQQAAQGVLTQNLVFKHAAKAYHLSTGSHVHMYTIESWCLYWLRNSEQSNRTSTHVRYSNVINPFLRSLGDRRKLNLQQIDIPDIEKFRDSELKAGKKNRTVNYAIKRVRSVLAAAQKQGLINRNVAAALSPLPEEGSQKKPFTAKQVEEILRTATGDWRGIILVAYFTGARLSDIVSMKWSNVHLEKGVIEFIEQKKQDRHRKKVVVPIHPVLMDYLLGCNVPDDGEISLFPSLADSRVGGRNGLSDSFKRILLKSGVISELYRKKSGDSVGREVSEFSFHSFRHTFLSNLANAGIPKDVREAMTAHKKGDTGENYTHRDVQTLQDAVAKLPLLNIT